MVEIVIIVLIICALSTQHNVVKLKQKLEQTNKILKSIEEKLR